MIESETDEFSNILSDAVELDSFYIRNRLVVNCGDLYKSQPNDVMTSIKA